MKWLSKWLLKSIKEEAAREKNEIDCIKVSAPSSAGLARASSHSIETIGMNFSVFKANGGYIIENRKYDPKTDRNVGGLHIITDDKDLGEELGKIITFESLRN